MCGLSAEVVRRSHSSAPPKSQFKGQGIHTAIPTVWFERCATGKHLRTIIWMVQFKLPFVRLTCVHKGQITVVRMIRNLNDHSNFALCSCVKTLVDLYCICSEPGCPLECYTRVIGMHQAHSSPLSTSSVFPLWRKFPEFREILIVSG